MDQESKARVVIKRLGRAGRLHRIIPILDSSGNIIHRVVKPLMVEVHPRDLMQILVGSAILAVPAAYTEETWKLGESLPLINVLFLAAISVCLISLFVYYNFYRNYFAEYVPQYVLRVFSIYFISIIVVGVLLTILQKCPWGTDPILAVKRVIIVALPASMSAAITDVLK